MAFDSLLLIIIFCLVCSADYEVALRQLFLRCGKLMSVVLAFLSAGILKRRAVVSRCVKFIVF